VEVETTMYNYADDDTLMVVNLAQYWWPDEDDIYDHEEAPQDKDMDTTHHMKSADVVVEINSRAPTTVHIEQVTK
jgi:hypothetical protein